VEEEIERAEVTPWRDLAGIAIGHASMVPASTGAAPLPSSAASRPTAGSATAGPATAGKATG